MLQARGEQVCEGQSKILYIVYIYLNANDIMNKLARSVACLHAIARANLYIISFAFKYNEQATPMK